MPASDDPGRYGANFADVYDTWYPGGDEHHVVAHLAGHLPRGSRVLELGVGTGRLALPLAAAGFDMVGMDASPEMLAAMTRKDPAGSVHAVCADAGDPRGWDAAGVAGSFDGILAACNLLLNLASPSQQRACVTGAAVRLRVGGVLIVELQQIQPDTSGEVTYELSTAKGDAPVVMATQTDPVTSNVRGDHIELFADGSSRIRSWSVCPIDVSTLDEWAGDSGLELVERHADSSRSPWNPDSPTSVTTYRRSPPPTVRSQPRNPRTTPDSCDGERGERVVTSRCEPLRAVAHRCTPLRADGPRPYPLGHDRAQSHDRAPSYD